MVINVGYLICEECAGYYELQDGEYPEDFDRCECGGNLEYVEEVKHQESSDDIFYNPLMRRIAGILVGAFMMVLPYSMLSPDPYSETFVYFSNLSFLIWGAGGLAAALIAGGNVRSGVSNGLYSAFISGLVIITYYFWVIDNYFTNPTLADNLALFGALCVVYILVPAVFSMVGGLIAGLARKILTKGDG